MSVPAAARDAADRSVRLPRNTVPVLAVLIVLGIWQLSGLFLNPILISTPAEVGRELFWLLRWGALELALVESLREMLIGLAAGLSVGIALGVLMGRYMTVEKLLAPFVNFFNATPLVVVIPLLVIWVGISIKARLLFVFLVTLWPVLLNTLAGIKNVQRGYVEVGMAFGLSESQMVRCISIPAAVPYILTGVRISAGLAIIGMIVSEMEVSFVGLGFLLLHFGSAFETGRLMAVIAVASLFGIVNVLAVKWVQARFFPWISAVAAEGQ
ncbi:MAG TPA: ABC transporter permease [bacterium]|nr:ABC transporter permease [bacterium]